MQIQSKIYQTRVNELSKQNGFLRLKIKMLEQKKSPSEITIINKQLYLDYMEEVLDNKEKQLIQTQKRIQRKHLDLIDQEAQFKLLSPLQNSTDIDIFLRKLEEVKAIVVGDCSKDTSFQYEQWRDFMKKQPRIVEQCRNYQKQTQNLIKTEYENLVRQRKQLAESMDKFEELHSYEKYLNQLQRLLEDKEKEVLERQNESQPQSRHTEKVEVQPVLLSFGRENRSMKEFQEKKRVKIFDSVNKSQQKRPLTQYESDRSSFYQNNSMYDQSSFIMQESENSESENSRQRTIYQERENQLEAKCKEDQIQIKRRQEQVDIKRKPEGFFQQNQVERIQQTESVGIQTNIQLLEESLHRVNKEKKITKFLQLWFKHSVNSQKNPSIILKKTFGLYLWKLNSVHNPEIPCHFKKTFDWPEMYEKSLKNQQLFPYSELSLNRKKYAELTLDLERKLLHQSKIKCALKNIIRNKNVKERIVFACYFKRYVEQAKLKGFYEYEKAIQKGVKISGKETTAMDPTSRYNTESRLVSVNSSRIMNECRASNEQVRQNSREGRKNRTMQLNPKSMSSTTLLNVPQQKVRAKENISPSDSFDAKKLKEFIRTHEEAEKALATQCVKTEAVCRLGQTLSQNIGKLLIKGFYEIKQSEEKERIEDLHKKISGYEFKWELFMTKCKLALVNNNNKISHLEDTLSFMLGK